MSPIAGYTTEVTVAASVRKVTDMLAKAGANTITSELNERGLITGMSFGIKTEFGWIPFRLPIRVDGVQATLKRDKVPPRYQTQEHAARVAWRIAHDWLRAQLALIDAGMTTLPEVMFPYAIVGNDQTAFEHYVTQQRAIEAGGRE